MYSKIYQFDWRTWFDQQLVARFPVTSLDSQCFGWLERSIGLESQGAGAMLGVFPEHSVQAQQQSLENKFKKWKSALTSPAPWISEPTFYVSEFQITTTKPSDFGTWHNMPTGHVFQTPQTHQENEE